MAISPTRSPPGVYRTEVDALGSTITQDILNSYMIMQMTLQMLRQAEFIELTLKQQMQSV